MDTTTPQPDSQDVENPNQGMINFITTTTQVDMLLVMSTNINTDILLKILATTPKDLHSSRDYQVFAATFQYLGVLNTIFAEHDKGDGSENQSKILQP